MVNLHPAGYVSSVAAAVDGNTQVGYGGFVNNIGNLVDRAMLWQGSAASFVNMHPGSGYSASRLEGVDGSTQVGSATVDSPASPVPQHAGMWQGTAASFVDLHPAGYSRSNALGIAGSLQVGVGLLTGMTGEHAMVWNSSATDFLDLHSTLDALAPAVPYESSTAISIDENGHIAGVIRNHLGQQFAVLWTPIPEPGCATLLVCGLSGMAGVARRKRTMEAVATD